MLHFLLKILFPSLCVNCGYLEELLCERCFHQLPFSPHTRQVDGLPVLAAFYYEKDTVLDHLIHSFKFEHQANAFRYLVPQMAETLRLFQYTDGLCFVPVPLHAERQRERGYNQAEFLARWLAKATGGDLWLGLKRVKATSVQSQLERRKDRALNVAEAFAVVRDPPSYRQMILVDDIVTSGSTLLACRDALQAADLDSILALTLANRELH